MSSKNIKSCDQSNCPVRTSGTCLESLEPEECPHFYWSDDDSTDNELSEEDLKILKAQLLELNNFILPTGDVLTLDEAIRVTHNFKPIIIMILGDGDSGKTTLSSTLHELFQRGPFADFWFAGSITPIAFEKRCHFSRVSSGRETPATEKTKSGDFNLLHLAVKHKDELSKPAIHILLSDISGELFKLARNSSDYIRSLTVLKSANRILITLDGKKLSNGKTKNAVITNAKTFVKKALEEGLFDKNTIIDFIITKWDELLISKYSSLEIDVVEPLSKLLEGKVKEISFEKVAARPNKPTTGIELGYGMDSLLNTWLKANDINNYDYEVLLNGSIYGELINARQFIKVLTYGIQNY